MPIIEWKRLRRESEVEKRATGRKQEIKAYASAERVFTSLVKREILREAVFL